MEALIEGACVMKALDRWQSAFCGLIWGLILYFLCLNALLTMDGPLSNIANARRFITIL